MNCKARLLFDSDELHYDFGPDHPLQPARLVALMNLLETSGLWHSAYEQDRLPSRPATLEELELVHTPDYIAAVQRLSQAHEGDPATELHSRDEDRVQAQRDESRAELALKYGFADGDTPALPGMHEVSARIVGGTLVALSAIMGLPEGGTFASEDERPLHIFHPAGGLHHAWAERASGFCVYNDIAVAIAHVLRASEAKVLYIDFDAHHGDGVQRAFYDEPRVMTVSFHETGRYLFPGTGDVLELGKGVGRGYSVNVPLQPYTEDDSYIEAMEALLTPLVISFAPDVIVSQHGCDTHAWDPLTHLSLTMRGIQAQVKLAHQLADTYCKGRWVALGGGGYDLYRVVPRAWSIVWAEMSGQELPVSLPEEWVERWQPVWLGVEAQETLAQQVMGKSSIPASFPTTFMDRPQDFPAQPRRWTISNTNRHTTALVRQLLLPPPVRQAFPTVHNRSPLAGLFDLLHLQGSATPSRSRSLETGKGTLLLRDFCPPSLIERLTIDAGLRAFARLPEREHQLLLSIARRPDCALTIAHTPSGEIVGEVTLAPGDEWWEGLENVYEVGIEVSANWRRLGIAKNLLAFALELDALEDIILYAMGLSWHWDMEGLGLNIYQYRELIARLFASQGFTEYPTTEPNVRMEPANILLARIGSRVDQRVASRFLSHLLSTPNLGGL
ncbi:MAG TPA: GNAT family N-acetyltransferase [Ktedonobacteraceae bacterium]|nr:GNAT family N-acetyltransferase [Ktedonobacteraceae bacterium]